MNPVIIALLNGIITLLGINTTEVIEGLKGLLTGGIIPVEGLIMLGIKLVIVAIYYLMHEDVNLKKESEA